MEILLILRYELFAYLVRREIVRQSGDEKEDFLLFPIDMKFIREGMKKGGRKRRGDRERGVKRGGERLLSSVSPLISFPLT
jgi:hypothetical protein